MVNLFSSLFGSYVRMMVNLFNSVATYVLLVLTYVPETATYRDTYSFSLPFRTKDQVYTVRRNIYT